MRHLALIVVLILQPLGIARAAVPGIPPEALNGWENLCSVFRDVHGRFQHQRSQSTDGEQKGCNNTVTEFAITEQGVVLKEDANGTPNVLVENPQYAFQAEWRSPDNAYRLEQFRTGEEAGRLRARLHKRISYICEPFLFASCQLAGTAVRDLVARDTFTLESLSYDKDRLTATMKFTCDPDEVTTITGGTVTFATSDNWAVQNFTCTTTSGSIEGKVQYRQFDGVSVPEFYEVASFGKKDTPVTRRVYRLLALERSTGEVPSLQDYGLSKPQLEIAHGQPAVRWWLVTVNVLAILSLPLAYWVGRSTMGSRLLAGRVVNRAAPWPVVIAGAFCFTSAGFPVWNQFGPPSRAPRIRCDRDELDVGQRRVGDRLDHDFVLYNTGGQNLTIRKMSATCGCITPLVSQAEIPPGHSLKLPVRIAVDLANEDLKKQLLLESNDPVNPKFVLQIRGRVVADRSDRRGDGT